MARLFCLAHQWLSHVKKAWPTIFLLLSSACQPIYSPSPPPTLLPPPTVTPRIELTPTAIPAIQSPTSTTRPTATTKPKVTLESTPTAQTSTLSPDGSWLVYRHDIYYDTLELYDELVVLNQDGSGRTLIKVPGCVILDGSSTPIKVPGCDFDNPIFLEEDPSNRIVKFPGKIMLIQPFQATGKLVYEPWPSLYTAFTGNTEGGFLANVYPPAPDANPELRIYELPSGKIHAQFPLVKCLDQILGCNFGYIYWWEFQWSPDGRYLAFPAIWDSASSDLYLYDVENGKIRQLTSGPERVGQIWWSPDGQWIVMGELQDSTYPYTSSLWSISVRGKEPRLLYSLEHPFPQGIVGWIDNERFVVYDGTNLFDALDLPADNLRLVDISSGEITTLFDGDFYNAEIDTANQTVAVYAADNPPDYEMGTYLVSITDPTPRLVTSDQFPSGYLSSRWNEAAGLFITDLPCEGDSEGLQAFDSDGKWQCIHLPILPESYPSPNGQWQVSLKGGVWLETEGQQAIQVSADQATQAIWCPNSSCFFFVANKTLYHVSLPDLEILTVDDRLKENWIVYQWSD